MHCRWPKTQGTQIPLWFHNIVSSENLENAAQFQLAVGPKNRNTKLKMTGQKRDRKTSARVA